MWQNRVHPSHGLYIRLPVYRCSCIRLTWKGLHSFPTSNSWRNLNHGESSPKDAGLILTNLSFIRQQRVRVHISCLKGPQDQIRSHNRNQFQVLPLFKHLHPKQELMQMIYNFLQQAFHHRNNQVKKSNGSFLSNGSSFKNDKVSTVTTSLNHNHVLRKRNSLNQIWRCHSKVQIQKEYTSILPLFLLQQSYLWWV